MQAYFSQFGTVLRLRLSRNRKTGHSKHYAFLEFASSDVAEIAAKTMNNYLLFGHILKCEVIPKEKVRVDLFKGANKRFKPVPWNRIERRRIETAKPRSVWAKKVESETKRREEKMEKLKALGYEFELPVLKKVDSLPAPDLPAIAPAVSAVEEQIDKELSQSQAHELQAAVRAG